MGEGANALQALRMRGAKSRTFFLRLAHKYDWQEFFLLIRLYQRLAKHYYDWQQIFLLLIRLFRELRVQYAYFVRGCRQPMLCHCVARLRPELVVEFNLAEIMYAENHFSFCA